MSITLKPLDELASDAKQGDLVKIALRGSDYVGYKWDIDPSLVKAQLLLPDDKDILFAGVNPYGVTRMEGDPIHYVEEHCYNIRDGLIVTKSIQFVGVNLKTRMLGNESIRGYTILERTRNTE